MPDPAHARGIAEAIGLALERTTVAIRGFQPVGGGCINHAARLETDAGTFFVKWNEAGPADLFEREADGLGEMERAGTSLVIPHVIAATTPQTDCPAFIVTEWLEPDTGNPDHTLGRGLAELHRHTAPQFGFASTTYCGSTPQPNAWCATWPELYATRRLQPLVTAIERERGMCTTEHSTYDRLIARLPELLSAASTPALIHGDLWAGNVLATARGPALVDPACAYAEREMEFGITTLFGGLSPRAWSAYLEAFPLPPGWRDRNPLYQLYHLLNHHLLFGGGYGAQALQVARRFA